MIEARPSHLPKSQILAIGESIEVVGKVSTDEDSIDGRNELSGPIDYHRWRSD